jgi:hypothetical protein
MVGNFNTALPSASPSQCVPVHLYFLSGSGFANLEHHWRRVLLAWACTIYWNDSPITEACQPDVTKHIFASTALLDEHVCSLQYCLIVIHILLLPSTECTCQWKEDQFCCFTTSPSLYLHTDYQMSRYNPQAVHYGLPVFWPLLMRWTAASLYLHLNI